ncbi:chloride channel protein [Frateuria aurantia]
MSEAVHPSLPSTSSAPPPKAMADGMTWRLWLGALIAGIAGGVAGILLASLLRLVQHLAYGYGGGHLISAQSFLDGVSAAPPLRRLAVMTVCGIVAGVGWWLLRRHARPLVSIARSLQSASAPMPVVATLLHALLQIVTVALGSPLGREVAPREVAAAWTQRVAARMGLSDGERRVVVACAAGAGLAAVYNVPLGGALFVMECLLLSFSWPVALCAMTSSALASGLASSVLGDGWQYHVPLWSRTHGLLWWSLLAGPLLGLAGEGFARLTDWARRRAPVGAGMIPWSLAVFSLIGLASMLYPQVLGNGRGPAAESFDASLSLQLALILLLLKLGAVTASLRAGAGGGLLTPTIAIGALFGLVLGNLWNAVSVAPTPGGAFALVGACAFLAASRRMPVTAVVLLDEFTHVSYDFLIPMMLAVAGACCLQHLCSRLRQ